jgi:hypothetical protein
MTADAHTEVRPGPGAWLAARLAAGKPAETWKPAAQIGRCGFSGYEISDTGCARSIDRAGRDGRPLTGGPVSTRPHKDGYVLLDLRCDNPDCKRAHTFTMQKVVLFTFDRRRPRGMQASHLSNNPAWNWYPEGLAWEDQPANEARKESRPPAPDPTHPCKNAPAGCPNLVINPGRRCVDCVAEAGRQIADMLRDHRPLHEVAEHFGYTSPDWAFDLAVKYGGYTGTKAEARTQRRPLKGFRKFAARLLDVA